jgi:hypothetical protein
VISVAAARAFSWNSLPLGFMIADIVLAGLFLVFMISVWHDSSGPKADGIRAAIPDPPQQGQTPAPSRASTSDVDKPRSAGSHWCTQRRVEAAAQSALAAAETAVAAADKASAAAERAATAASVDERAMAASSVGSFVTLGIAAAAVLLTGAGVLLGVEGGAAPLPHRVFSQLVLATGWLVASLIFGALSAAYVINHIHHAASVAENRLVNFFGAGQLCALVVGATCFMLSIVLF